MIVAVRRLGLVLALGVAGTASAGQPPTPIPGPLSGPLPQFQGAPVAARPLRVPRVAHERSLAPNGLSGTGLAAGNGDLSPFPGPLGVGTTSASAVQMGTCAGLAFDAEGRLLAVCKGAASNLRLLDPQTLETIVSLALPTKPGADRGDLAGGTHFVRRADGTLLVPTVNGTLLVVSVADAALTQTGTVDLTKALRPSERLFAVAAGFDGRDWAAGADGSVVTVPRGGGAPKALALGEPVAEDIATDRSGTYVVTTRALYRLRARADGTPRVVWRQPLPSAEADAHAGRVHAGPGTAPVLVARRFVAVADGLNSPRVTVVRIRGRASRRLACAVPVFKPGAGSIEAPLVVAGRSIVAINAYGYDNPASTEAGRTTVGGLARVIVRRHGCRRGWTSDQVSPSAQAVVSRRTGLLYTLVKPAGAPDAWDLAALDWRTGERRFAVLAGEGLGYNSDGGAVVLGPDGAAYAGTFGGVVRFKDGSA